jgi:hypothetical protein
VPRAARALLLAALAVGSGAYGYLVGARHWFPYQQLRGLATRSTGVPTPGDGIDEPPANRERVDTGWYEVARRPGGPSREEILASLDELGYLDTYEDAAGEFGVQIHDRERTAPGVNLVVSAHAPEAFLADLDGQVLHRWSFAFDGLEKPPGYVPPPSDFGERYFRRVHLFENGDLLALFERTGLVELDRDSALRWGLTGYFHHDLDVAADGTIHVLTHEVGVIPRIHATRDTFEDFVTRVSPDGQVLGRFSLLEAFERSDYAPMLARLPDREDVFHTNTLTLLDGSLAHVSPHFGAGKALISVWGLDTVAVVDLESETVEWALTGFWHRQHEPVLLDSGSLLVFDNLGPGDYSRVIELEPFTQRVLWSYTGSPENDFSSAVLGSVQRLSNGNTLVTESTAGRAFELTPENEVVWRWTSPYRAGPNGEGVAVLVEVVRLDPPAWLAPR